MFEQDPVQCLVGNYLQCLESYLQEFFMEQGLVYWRLWFYLLAGSDTWSEYLLCG